MPIKLQPRGSVAQRSAFGGSPLTMASLNNAPQYNPMNNGQVFSTTSNQSQGGGGGMPRTLQNMWGGNPGVGSMQPGRVVSHMTRKSPTQRKQQKAMEGLMASMKTSQEAANSAGMQRYNDLIKSMAGLKTDVLGTGGTFDQAQQLLGTSGDTARQRVTSQGIAQQGQAEQNLISRGLGNTTVRSSVQRGIGSDMERSMQSIDERVAGQKSDLLRQKAGFQTQIGTLQGDSILSRDDQGPQMAQYLSLLQSLGASGGI